MEGAGGSPDGRWANTLKWEFGVAVENWQMLIKPALWERIKLPAGKIIAPGMVTHSTDVVEHPELVSQRIQRFAKLVGPERVIAGADCGFASFAGSNEVHPSIVWAKFKSLVDGSRLASQRLWKK